MVIPFKLTPSFIRSIICIAMFIISPLTWATTFESSVDRTQVAEGESIVLTLRYNSNVFSGDPDFTPLNQQFDVINTDRKNNFRYINGRSESWTIWTIAIIPKRKGNLVIPSFNFKGESTKPIAITVSKVSDAIKNQQKEVFFHTEVDVTTAYVQSQVLYTEKLYFSVPLENSQLSEVQVDEAVVQPLGEIKQYRTQLQGRSYEVYERQSLIFPQTSGELVIPGPIYTGEVSNGRWRGGRPIRISHGPTKLAVLPKPASYPDGTWLPATDMQLDYKWQGNPHQLSVGEPITLEVSLTAHGLTSAQLPDLSLPKINNLKYYPDQAQTTDESINTGIIGNRTQSIAIVATKSGNLTLPEIKIPWWNTQLGQLEYAVLPAQQLSAINASNNKQTQQNPQPDEYSQASNNANETAATTAASETNGYIWPILTAVFALLWLITSAFLWRLKQQVKLSSANQTVANFVKPSANLKNIKHQCRNNNPAMARAAILAWAQDQWQMPFASLSQVSKQITDPALQTALHELDYTLYSETGNSAWQGEYLWQLFSAYKPNANARSEQLAPLYPTEKAVND